MCVCVGMCVCVSVCVCVTVVTACRRANNDGVNDHGYACK